MYLNVNDTAYLEYHQWRLATPKTEHDFTIYDREFSLFCFGSVSLDLNKNRSNPYQKSASLFAKKSCWQTVGSRVGDFTDRMTKQSIETAMLLVEKVF